MNTGLTIYTNVTLVENTIKHRIATKEVTKNKTQILISSSKTNDRLDVALNIASITTFISRYYLEKLESCSAHPIGTATLMREYVDKLISMFISLSEETITNYGIVKSIAIGFISTEILKHIEDNMTTVSSNFDTHYQEFFSSYHSAVENEAKKATLAVDSLVSTLNENDEPLFKYEIVTSPVSVFRETITCDKCLNGTYNYTETLSTGLNLHVCKNCNSSIEISSKYPNIIVK